MKRSILTRSLFVVCMLGGIRCEDGPAQTLTPLPPGGGDRINDSKNPGTVGSASQSFQIPYNPGNKNEICSADQKRRVWAEAFQQPIRPPGVGAGVDLAGGPNGDGRPAQDLSDKKESWKGITIDQIERPDFLCQSTFLQDHGSQILNYWGDTYEIVAWYLVSNRKIQMLSFLAPGYRGKLEATSRSGDKLTVALDSEKPITDKDGNYLLIDWKNQRSLRAAVRRLYNAIAFTYSLFPDVEDPIAEGKAIVNPRAINAYISFPGLGVSFWFANTVVSQPAASTPYRIDIEKAKIMGFSDGQVFLKNDELGVGPTVTRTQVWKTNKDCTLRMGIPFGELKSTCIAPYDDSSKNELEFAKIYSSFAHDRERYSFDIVGVDPRVRANTLAENNIINDDMKPTDEDDVSYLGINQSLIGLILNDFKDNKIVAPQNPGDPTIASQKDWHGFGLVMLEWATLMQRWFHENVNRPRMWKEYELGAKECLSDTPAEGCTGLEGIVTTAPTNALGRPRDKEFNALGPAAALEETGGFLEYQIGLKPDVWYSFFCKDAGGLNGDGTLNGYKKCFGGNLDRSLPQTMFDAAYYRLVNVAGKGSEQNLPAEARDIRFTFKQWVYAFVKYLSVADRTNLKLADIDAIKLDTNNLFFDTSGGGFEYAQYIDRSRVINDNTPPLNIIIYVDILRGIMDSFNFDRDLRRPEEFSYTITREDKNKPLGAENSALITNLFGSPVLRQAYRSYTCATNDNSKPDVIAACKGVVAPYKSFREEDDGMGGKKKIYDFIRNDDGSLLLSPYKAVWAQPPFEIGYTAPLKIVEDFPVYQAALVEAPIFDNPYDPESTKIGTIQKLIPQRDRGAGVGFPIPLNGAIKKWIESDELDFYGAILKANISYETQIDPDTKQRLGLKIQGVEAASYLGDVFVCRDPSTKDILKVRMYDTAARIVDWFQEHPGTKEDCQIIFTYAPYLNYLDFITSHKNGIAVGIQSGAAKGRVGEVVLFEPSLVGQ